MWALCVNLLNWHMYLRGVWHGWGWLIAIRDIKMTTCYHDIGLCALINIIERAYVTIKERKKNLHFYTKGESTLNSVFSVIWYFMSVW